MNSLSIFRLFIGLGFYLLASLESAAQSQLDSDSLNAQVLSIITEYERNLNLIANSSPDDLTRTIAGQQMLDLFAGPNSAIQVSSLNRNTREYTIRQYITNLSRLKQNKGYTNVRFWIDFDHTELSCRTFEFSGLTFLDVDLKAWQMFEGKSAEFTYRDRTKKVFRILVVPGAENTYSLRILSVKVDQTLPLNISDEGYVK